MKPGNAALQDSVVPALGGKNSTALIVDSIVAQVEVAVTAVRVAPAKRMRYWLGWLALLLLTAWIFDIGVSLLLRHGAAKRYLTAKLERAFGRPVEVGRYAFSLLGGLRVEAAPITVAEDPRFGYEYFLRAERLSARIKPLSLLRGRIELGTLSFIRPSLNIVQSRDGRWNLAEWLPRPDASSSAPSRTATPPRENAGLQRIEIDSGRINFKRDTNKLPFALVSVAGSLEQEMPGRWHLELDAQPERAAVVVQHAGTLHLSGILGGTSSRLRPANLKLSWQDGSISDFLRLARNYDQGIRGNFSAELTARTEGPQWTFAGRAEIRRLHSWDLSLRPDDPAVNLQAGAVWSPVQSRVQLTQGIVQTPRSALRLSGAFAWRSEQAGGRAATNRISSTGRQGGSSRLSDAAQSADQAGFAAGAVRGLDLRISSSSVDFDDVLLWYRAFHPGVADEIALDGTATLDATLHGWPPVVQQATVNTKGFSIEAGNLPAPLHFGPARFSFQGNTWNVGQVGAGFGSEDAAFAISASGKRAGRWQSSATITGGTGHAEDIFELAGLLGFSLPQGWTLQGPARVNLSWSGSRQPFANMLQPRGSVSASGMALRAPFLNSPVADIKGTLELSAAGERMSLKSAEALGAAWEGSLVHRNGATDWVVDVTADRLSAAGLDRSLNPHWRETLLQRVLPFLSNPAKPASLPANFRAHGQLALQEFLLAPVAISKIQTKLEMDSRRLLLPQIKGEFYGGDLHGALEVDFGSTPHYRGQVSVDGVDLEKLTHASAAWHEIFSGTAEGRMEFEMHGLGRDALLSSLACRGEAQARDAGIHSLDLFESLKRGAYLPGDSSFDAASAEFSCAASKVHFLPLLLGAGGTELEATGNVDQQHNFKFRIREIPVPALAVGAAPVSSRSQDASPGRRANVREPAVYQMDGPLAAPQITRIEPAARAQQ